MPIKPPTERQASLLWFALTGVALATVVALLTAGIWGVGKILDLLSPVIWPLAIAAVVACLLSPIVDFLETRRVPRAHSILLVFALVIATVGAMVASIIPQVLDETGQLVHKVPEYTQRLQERINHLMASPPAFLQHLEPKSMEDQPAATPAQNPLLASATDWVKERLPEAGTWVLQHLARVASGFGLLASLVLVPVYAFYFLLEKRPIQQHWRDYIPFQNPAARAEVVFLCESISQYLVAFFRGQLLVAICDAVLYTIGFLLAGLNYAFLLGLSAVLLLMIPFIGAMVICVSALLLAFVQFGDWRHPAMVLGVVAVVQALESLVISPKIMGDRVGLHPLIIIIAVMVGTTLFGGLLGGILAIPLAAALRVILARYLWKQAPAHPIA
jgi:predicted PurR-regulated permease PerM